MKHSSVILLCSALIGLVVTACSQPQPTPREALIQRLQDLQQRGCMFGHQDDPFYGIGWEYEDGRGDVRETCGDYPAIMGFDLGGFSFGDMLDAFYRNKRSGCIVAGGSTISQQTAKNVFCTPARTYTRKLFEAYFTVLIELLWGKQRILEVYLNVIELGDGIFGVEYAADEYFSTSALRLNARQSAALTDIIPCTRCYTAWLYGIE